MLYVSEVRNAFGVAVNSSAIMRGVSFIVHDSASGEDYSDFSGRDCLGYSDVARVAVRYTEKEAKLHDYIVSASTRKSENGNLGIVDRFEELYKQEDSTTAVIAIPDELIDVFGDRGSVVTRTAYDTGVVTRCTLYDLLIFLCRQAGVYLMHKDVLLIDSGLLSLRTRIEFRHSVEADRFFTKLYMEACGQDGVGQV